jgi:hypothetical protein
MTTFRQVSCTLLLSLSLASTASAQSTFDEFNKTIMGVGSQQAQQTSNGYLYVVENWTSTNCSNNVVYIDLTTAAGRGMYATLLSAQAQGRKLYRVNYTATSSGNATTCTANLIELR